VEVTVARWKEWVEWAAVRGRVEEFAPSGGHPLYPEGNRQEPGFEFHTAFFCFSVSRFGTNLLFLGRVVLRHWRTGALGAHVAAAECWAVVQRVPVGDSRDRPVRAIDMMESRVAFSDRGAEVSCRL